eukprot:2533505-Rhodomonas_salina.2
MVARATRLSVRQPDGSLELEVGNVAGVSWHPAVIAQVEDLIKPCAIAPRVSARSLGSLSRNSVTVDRLLDEQGFEHLALLAKRAIVFRNPGLVALEQKILSVPSQICIRAPQ